MSTFLFNEIIFGPVKSRRLGVSLGINLLPINKKYCNFDCIYCECGWSNLIKVKRSDLPARDQISASLKSKLIEMSRSGEVPDVITFAGNGEPTMHPEFEQIIDDTVLIRNANCPSAKIAVLCNSTLIHKKNISRALVKTDQIILKLDSVWDLTFNALNKPAPGIKIEDIISKLISFNGKIIVQTMFIRGYYNGQLIDNTTNIEIDGLIKTYKKIQPELIMIYTYQRDTAAQNLEKISEDELKKIGEKMQAAGFIVEISA